MLNWLKRPDAGQSTKRARVEVVRRALPATRQEVDVTPAPLPEVVAEGNTHADWSAWEDSMTALDSQFQGLDPASRFQVRETGASQLDELDPFSGIAQRRSR